MEGAMDDYLNESLELVKAQASVRPMTVEEITSMIRNLAVQLQKMSAGAPLSAEDGAAAEDRDPMRAIKDKSVTCLECGKTFSIITKRHLAMHGMTTEEYRAKHGYPKKMPLACKALVRARRAKMKEMRLWEKRAVKPAA
jgi:predicted transcriptional regulator